MGVFQVMVSFDSKYTVPHQENRQVELMKGKNIVQCPVPSLIKPAGDTSTNSYGGCGGGSSSNSSKNEAVIAAVASCPAAAGPEKYVSSWNPFS